MLSKNKFKIEKLDCEITQSSEYDILLKLAADCTITVTCDKNVKSNEIPRIEIQSTDNINFVFVDEWPELENGAKSLIKCFTPKTVDVILNGNVPIEIDSKVTQFHLNNTRCSVYGPVSYKQVPITFDSNINEKSEIRITRNIFVPDPASPEPVSFIEVRNSSISVKVSEITISYFINVNLIFGFMNSICTMGSSSIEIDQKLPGKVSIYSVFSINSEFVGDIGDETKLQFFMQENIILKARSSDLSFDSLELSYVQDEKKEHTHGFYEASNCLKLQVEDLTLGFKAIKLVRNEWPSKIPVFIDITSDETGAGDFIISPTNKDDLNKISTKIPINCKTIMYRFYIDLWDESLIDLSKFGALDILLVSTGNTKNKIYVSVPNNLKIALTFSNVNINFKSEEDSKHNIICKQLNFTDCSFGDSKSFSIGINEIQFLILDVDSLTELISNKALNKFDNKLLIQSSNNILFAKNGWSFKENEIKDPIFVDSTLFTDVSFQTNRVLSLSIEDPTLTEIKGLKIDTFPLEDRLSYISLSRFWSNITNIDNMIVNTIDGNGFSVVSASYPVPNMFTNVNVVISLHVDKYGKFDPIIYKDNYTINNIKISLDLQPLPEEFHTIKGHRMIFEGDTEFKLADNVGSLEIDQLAIFGNSSFSKVSIKEKLEMQQNSVVNGNIDVGSNSMIEIHWIIDKIPKIILNEQKVAQPKSINIIFDDSDFSKDDYNEKLFNNEGYVLVQGKFDCQQMLKSNISFISTYKFFNGTDNVLGVRCDYSSQGQVLLLYGAREINDGSDDDDQSGGSVTNKPLPTGGVVGIVIAVAVIVAILVAVIVFKVQKRAYMTMMNKKDNEDEDEEVLDPETSECNIEEK